MRLLLFLMLFFFSCSVNEAARDSYTFQSVEKPIPIHGLVKDTIAGVQVLLIQDFDDSLITHPTLLVLPGWNFAASRWLDETRLRKLADSLHYRLVLPEMQRSVYATHYYAETTADMRAQPSGKWITDTLIPALQAKYGILKTTQFNGVMGLSTGGRGALYCLWKCPDVFSAAAALSGDFNQADMPNDRLMTAVYGTFTQHRNRWQQDDNAYAHAAEIRHPVFIAHGMNDAVVPPVQSTTMLARLKKEHPQQTYASHFPATEGHTFHFWDVELTGVFAFFQYTRNNPEKLLTK